MYSEMIYVCPTYWQISKDEPGLWSSLFSNEQKKSAHSRWVCVCVCVRTNAEANLSCFSLSAPESGGKWSHSEPVTPLSTGQSNDAEKRFSGGNSGPSQAFGLTVIPLGLSPRPNRKRPILVPYCAARPVRRRPIVSPVRSMTLSDFSGPGP